jgi:hypothetical protein
VTHRGHRPVQSVVRLDQPFRLTRRSIYHRDRVPGNPQAVIGIADAPSPDPELHLPLVPTPQRNVLRLLADHWHYALWLVVTAWVLVGSGVAFARGLTALGTLLLVVGLSSIAAYLLGRRWENEDQVGAVVPEDRTPNIGTNRIAAFLIRRGILYQKTRRFIPLGSFLRAGGTIAAGSLVALGIGLTQFFSHDSFRNDWLQYMAAGCLVALGGLALLWVLCITTLYLYRRHQRTPPVDS